MGILEKMRLDEKKIVVTGSAKGIGEQLAMSLSEAGAEVAIVDVDIKATQKTAKEIFQATNKRTIAIKTDTTQPDEINAMIDTIGIWPTGCCVL
ncbi:SDR family NAD(P)-dependent oxidoreductase [Photorhabdus stackebrandtii]|uniref:SDR family NAD(P)-dependent oxidoreductase n=1 Tax=Photorhabdus stackebrandtii TaxID=1123042 RepID=UPI001A98C0AE|nr:SDR family NAD(P)-dependent oxidoreductase [Photorhabdus stackebrandtii]